MDRRRSKAAAPDPTTKSATKEIFRMNKFASTLALATVLFAGTAQAQFLLDQAQGVGLSNDDYGELKAAAASLYEAADPKVGDETIWSGENGGSHGTVELTAFDGTCATLRHAFRTDRRGEVFRTQEKRCKADDGRWLITPIEN